MHFRFSVSIIFLFGLITVFDNIVSVVDSAIVIDTGHGIPKAVNRHRGLAPFMNEKVDPIALKKRNIEFLRSIVVSENDTVVEANDSDTVSGNRRDLLEDEQILDPASNHTANKQPPTRRSAHERITRGLALQKRLQLHEFVNDSLHAFAEFLESQDTSLDSTDKNTTTTDTEPLVPEPAGPSKCSTAACKVVTLITSIVNNNIDF